MNILETIARNLILKRAEQGLSQQDVATKLGIARQNYRLYETGKHEIKVSKLSKMANVFNIDIVELLKD